jgi:hypothetical protein
MRFSKRKKKFFDRYFSSWNIFVTYVTLYILIYEVHEVHCVIVSRKVKKLIMFMWIYEAKIRATISIKLSRVEKLHQEQ